MPVLFHILYVFISWKRLHSHDPIRDLPASVLTFLVLQDKMPAYTVGDYLAERLDQMEVTHHFVVPGDYNLALLDRLNAHPGLTQVGCTNELNCSLAAEGYARACGVGVCVVTYSVGAFSAFNGLGSAYAENLPLLLVSGAPNTNDTDHRILHHTLGEYDKTYQLAMARKITCCAVAIRQADQAPELIDQAIQTALSLRKPAYIEMPANLAGEACARPGPVTGLLVPNQSDRLTLIAAVNAAAKIIKSKLKPVIVIGPGIRNSGAEDDLSRLAEAIGCAVVLQPAAKGCFPEDHNQFAGIFWGQVSTLDADVIVNWADILICIGTVFTDYSTVGWTAMPNTAQVIVGINSVTVTKNDPESYFHRVWMGDFLAMLAQQVAWNDTTLLEYRRLKRDIGSEYFSCGRDKLTRKEVTHQVQLLLSREKTLFSDTGDSWFNCIQLQLPNGTGFEIEMQWGHIGWAIPASLGYALARPEKRVIVMIGDGAFQITFQEISQMVRMKVPIIIFLMNNRGYTIETEIHDGPYNRIQNWKYASLVQAFNGTDGGGRALGFKVETVDEMSQAIERAIPHRNGPVVIECEIDQDDCSIPLITWGHFVAAANARRPLKD